VRVSTVHQAGAVRPAAPRRIQSLRELVLEILGDINPDVDFDKATAIIDDKLLDSFDIVTLVGELNDAFDISIGVVDLVPGNFNTVDAIVGLVARLQDL
jgi:acyl carrier protein